MRNASRITTVTQNQEADPAAVRAIYYYHAVTRGWGDIGYNFLKVDPTGSGFFVDKPNVPNICGHRDVLATECPGDRLYARLPAIRSWVKAAE